MPLAEEATCRVKWEILQLADLAIERAGNRIDQPASQCRSIRSSDNDACDGFTEKRGDGQGPSEYAAMMTS